MTATAPENPDDAKLARASRRIAWLTLALGLATAAVVYFAKSSRAGVGIAIGTVLAWINYRWLDQSLGLLVTVSTATPGSAQARGVPASFYWKLCGRYVLIAVVIYVIVHYFALPLVSVLVGLLALGAGAIVGSVYEVSTESE
jgi:ATP synthase I chain